ncbi:filaggrin-like isoform X2 [Branchiostoma lanceolatum]|uniref:filaggrin-like isoform X2 n=1 Tax=Branchiostoma lanceolatum TaxID=7740 RepID=UPI0034565B91
MRRRSVQNERVAYWNSKLILNEEKRIQKSVVQNWLNNCHTEQTPIDRGRHYSDTSGGQKESPDVAMSNSSHFGGSMPDLLNYKGKDHHGSLRSHGTTDGLDSIGEGMEETLPEDANDEHIEAGDPKGQAAKPIDSLPSTQRKDDGKRPNRKIKATNACQDLATSGEVSRRPSAPTHQSRKHQSVRSRDRDSKSPRGVEVRITADIVSHFFEDERIPKTDRRPGHDPKVKGDEHVACRTKSPSRALRKLKSMMTHLSHRRQRGNSDTGFFRQDEGVSGEKVALPSRKHPEKQDVRNKKPPQDNRNPRKPRSPSRGQKKPGSPSRSPRRKHSPSRSPRRRRSPSRGPEKPGNPSRRDRPAKGKRTTKNEPGRSRSMDVGGKRPNRGQRPSARDQSKLRSRGSTETPSDGKSGLVKGKEEQRIEGKRNPSRGLKTDQTSEGNTSTGWASKMSLATTADDAGVSGSVKTRLQDDKRANWKTYKANGDLHKAQDTNAMSGFFNSFKGSFLNLVGGDEQKEKNPTELGVPGWYEDTGSSHGKASDDSKRTSGRNGRLFHNAPPMVFVVPSSDHELSDEQNVSLGSFKAGEDHTSRRRGSRFFDSFKGSFMNLLGGDEQNEKNPTELGEPGWGEDTGSSHGKASDDSRRSSGSSGKLLYNAPPMEYVVDSSDNKLSDENLVILGSFKAGEDNTGRRRGSQPIGRGAAMLSDFASGVKTFLRIPETETVEDRGTYEDHIPGIVHNMVIGGQAGKNQEENSPSLLDSLKSSFDSWTTGESEKRRPSFVGSWKRGEDTGSHRDAGNSGFMNSLKQSLWGDSGRDQQESRVQIFPPQNEKSTKRSDDKENMDWFSPRSWWSSIEDLLGMAPDEERAPRRAGPACGNQRHRRRSSDKNVDPNTLSPMDMYPRRRRGSNASAVSSASRTERRRSSDKNTDLNTLSPLSYLKSSGRRRSSASSVSGSSMPDLSWFSNMPGKKKKEKKKT